MLIDTIDIKNKITGQSEKYELSITCNIYNYLLQCKMIDGFEMRPNLTNGEITPHRPKGHYEFKSYFSSLYSTVRAVKEHLIKLKIKSSNSVKDLENISTEINNTLDKITSEKTYLKIKASQLNQIEKLSETLKASAPKARATRALNKAKGIERKKKIKPVAQRRTTKGNK